MKDMWMGGCKDIYEDEWIQIHTDRCRDATVDKSLRV